MGVCPFILHSFTQHIISVHIIPQKLPKGQDGFAVSSLAGWWVGGGGGVLRAGGGWVLAGRKQQKGGGGGGGRWGFGKNAPGVGGGGGG